MKKTALIIGGTSGLGLELAQLIHKTENLNVIVTGRTDPKIPGIEYRYLNLDGGIRTELPVLVDDIQTRMGDIDTFVYSAGYYQVGRLDDLTEIEISKMINVGLYAPILLLRKILRGQRGIRRVVLITSTSQWTPRLLEPVYTAVKAGLGMLGNSLSLDSLVLKTLVAGPAGMATPFWDGTGRDTRDMLDPMWVAKQILAHLRDDYKYRFIKIFRQPNRVEVIETRS